MAMAWGKMIFHECVACVCLTFGTVFLVIAFFMAIGFLMGVMTISFALPLDLYKPLWNSKNGYFTKILFQKIPIYYQNYHDCLENNLQFLLVPIKIQSF